MLDCVHVQENFALKKLGKKSDNLFLNFSVFIKNEHVSEFWKSLQLVHYNTHYWLLRCFRLSVVCATQKLEPSNRISNDHIS